MKILVRHILGWSSICIYIWWCRSNGCCYWLSSLLASQTSNANTNCR